MPDPKFSPGDRVRNTDPDYLYADLHAEGTVDEYGTYCPWVIWDNVKPDVLEKLNQKRWAQSENLLELIPDHRSR